MDYQRGVYHFKGGEDHIAFRWMWTCLTDTSLWGRIVLTWRIWTKQPPDRYFNLDDE